MNIKKTILISALAMLIFACNSPSAKEGKNSSNDSTKVQKFDTAKLAKGDAYYQCPMDPQVMSDKPGTCPICKMDLSKAYKK